MKKQTKLDVIQEPWYQEGLRFECTECGKCCTGQPGYVWVTSEDIERIANHLNIPVKKFMRLYTRQKGNRYALLERRSQNYDCVFLENQRCSIYEVRPTQCKTYPWWVNNLTSEESWKRASKECEGIRHDSPIVPIDIIEKNLAQHRSIE